VLPSIPIVGNLPDCCARRKRPCRRSTAEQRDELAALHLLDRIGLSRWAVWEDEEIGLRGPNLSGSAISQARSVVKRWLARQGTAALRDFRAADVRYGSFATDAVEATRACMSALPPKADIERGGRHVRLVPIAS
jgi:hypothetical protein